MLRVKSIYNNKNLNKDDLVLDIETTGLDPSFDSLVLLGLIYYDYDKKKFYIDQYFAINDKEEKKLLAIYLKKTSKRKLITYNGEIFDLPFLNIRLSKNNMDNIFPENKDIYKIIKSKRKLIRFESMKLIDIEKKIGIERSDPSRYKVVSKLSEDIKNRDKPWPIIIHNKNDLISTEKLANVEDIIKRKLSKDHKGLTIALDYAYIKKDMAYINLSSNKKLPESFFTKNNYLVKIKGNEIKLNIMVIYGKLAKDISGYVTINNFNIQNKSDYVINENLIIIKEDRIFNCENILNIGIEILKKNLNLWI